MDKRFLVSLEMTVLPVFVQTLSRSQKSEIRGQNTDAISRQLSAGNNLLCVGFDPGIFFGIFDNVLTNKRLPGLRPSRLHCDINVTHVETSTYRIIQKHLFRKTNVYYFKRLSN